MKRAYRSREYSGQIFYFPGKTWNVTLAATAGKKFFLKQMKFSILRILHGESLSSLARSLSLSLKRDRLSACTCVALTKIPVRPSWSTLFHMMQRSRKLAVMITNESMRAHENSFSRFLVKSVFLNNNAYIPYTAITSVNILLRYKFARRVCIYYVYMKASLHIVFISLCIHIRMYPRAASQTCFSISFRAYQSFQSSSTLEFFRFSFFSTLVFFFHLQLLSTFFFAAETSSRSSACLLFSRPSKASIARRRVSLRKARALTSNL